MMWIHDDDGLQAIIYTILIWATIALIVYMSGGYHK